MLDTFYLLFVALMTGTLLPDVNDHIRIVHRCLESGGIRLRSQIAYHHRRNHGSQASTTRSLR
jgi:hypothetical protein